METSELKKITLDSSYFTFITSCLITSTGSTNVLPGRENDRKQVFIKYACVQSLFSKQLSVSIRIHCYNDINEMRSLTFPGKQIEVSAGQPQFLLMSPCAAAGVAVGGLSFQPRCNLASLGQHWGLHSLITATVMKC